MKLIKYDNPSYFEDIDSLPICLFTLANWVIFESKAHNNEKIKILHKLYGIKPKQHFGKPMFSFKKGFVKWKVWVVECEGSTVFVIRIKRLTHNGTEIYFDDREKHNKEKLLNEFLKLEI